MQTFLNYLNLEVLEVKWKIYSFSFILIKLIEQEKISRALLKVRVAAEAIWAEGKTMQALISCSRFAYLEATFVALFLFNKVINRLS